MWRQTSNNHKFAPHNNSRFSKTWPWPHLWNTQFDIYYYMNKENDATAINKNRVYGQFRTSTLNKAHIEIIF